ncbi:MAG: hypothetical protein DI536_04155 [Archangium gephyra]|uniref:Uncharacterized protein n=1 Tax=Archangium gephyra TaxID=48 RepID=A0A2W5TW50_9BACT|nr:MAG: hypothetical protein DI536_04155 [Archangium gephyra]
MSDQILYGFDSSLTHFGYAVAVRRRTSLVSFQFVACGVWATKPDADAETRTADLGARLQGIAGLLFQLVEHHGRPALLACEALALPWGKTSMQTVSTLGRARGLVDALAGQHRQQVHEVQPAQLKRIVTGDQKASKQQVIAAMVARYPELAALFAQLKAANVEHAADAAAAIHAVTTTP